MKWIISLLLGLFFIILPTTIFAPKVTSNSGILVGIGIEDAFRDKSIANSKVKVIVTQSNLKVGDKYTKGNYEYSYGQMFETEDSWETITGQDGWGVRVIDKAQTDYENPLTMIKG